MGLRLAGGIILNHILNTNFKSNFERSDQKTSSISHLHFFLFTPYRRSTSS